MCVFFAALPAAASAAATAAAVAADVALVASMGMTAASSIQQGKAQEEAGKYNAKVQENNAAMQEWAAADAKKTGAAEAEQATERARRAVGTQVAQAAAGGLLSDAGTPLDFIEDTARLGELDSLTAINNAQRRAFGYQVQGTDSLASARLSRYQGSNAKTTGYLNAAGSLLAGGANAYRTFKTPVASPAPIK